MVSALYQSRFSKGGTRQFTCDGEIFGWEVIVDMYKRETERRKTGQYVQVPKLKANHVHRDAWTRLNALPSKMMQVCFVNAWYPVFSTMIKICMCL